MAVVRITVYKVDREYFATRTLTPEIDFLPPGTIFSQEKEIQPKQLASFEEEIRQECRRRGIAKVINLDK